MADFGICRADGCSKPAYTRKTGLCGMHASRMKRGGTFDRRKPKKSIADLVGAEVVGMWTIVGEGGPYLRPDNGAPMRTAVCRCECGTIRSVAAHTLRQGMTLHCGCLVREVVSIFTTKHGMSQSPEYRSWSHLKSRCLNPDNDDYPDYGGRGIMVCDRWQSSFDAFYEDMGAKPSPAHSIDRINNDGNYEPGNCRWADAVTQANNKRRKPHG